MSLLVGLQGLMSKRTRGYPAVWTQQPVWGANIQRGVAFGNAAWAAVGDSTDGLGYASVPTSWTQSGTPPYTTTQYGLDFTNGYFIVCPHSEDGSFAYATDPTGAFTTGTCTIARYAMSSGYDTNNSLYLITGHGGDISTAATLAGAWTARTSNMGSSDIRGNATDGTTFVLCGDGGKLSTATNVSSTWTLHGTPGFGGDIIFDVAYDGSQYFVAVGDNGKFAYCNGTPTGTWTQITGGDNPFGGTRIHSVAYGNGVWKAVAKSGKIATITGAPTGTWSTETSSFSSTDIYAIAYSSTQGVWTATGASGKIAIKAG